MLWCIKTNRKSCCHFIFVGLRTAEPFISKIEKIKILDDSKNLNNDPEPETEGIKGNMKHFFHFMENLIRIWLSETLFHHCPLLVALFMGVQTVAPGTILCPPRTAVQVHFVKKFLIFSVGNKLKEFPD